MSVGVSTHSPLSCLQAVGAQLREDLVTAPDWECLVAAHAARGLHAPLGTRISLHQTVVLTQK